MNATIQPLGDSAALVTWPSVADDLIPDLIQQLAMSLQLRSGQEFQGIVPGFASLTLHYDPVRLRWAEVDELIENGLSTMIGQPQPQGMLVEIPVCYAAEFAIDIEDLATVHSLTVDEVIRLHSGADYTVRMIGFSPGFPYLAGLPKQLATPRKSTPRLNVPAGSVAIGGCQTGIYSMETPGGWHIIGRTPIRLFQPQHDPPCLLRAGDHVRFVPVPRIEFADRQEPQ